MNQEQNNTNTDNTDQEVIREKAKAKARLLKALADRGIGGEKTSAENKLKEHLAKHKLTLGDIDSTFNDRYFKVRSQDDKTVLMNVILSVNPFTRVDDMKTSVVANLDEEDYQEVIRKFTHFAKLFRADKSVFTMAFFKKHEEFFQPDEFTRKKWREKYNINEGLSSQQVEVDKLNEIVLSAKSKDDLNDEHFKLLKRLERMTKMMDGLQDANYFRIGKTIGEKKTN
jgi:hypothetical protein